MIDSPVLVVVLYAPPVKNGIIARRMIPIHMQDSETEIFVVITFRFVKVF